MRAIQIKDIARALEAWAPKATQQSYDNVGLQVGDPSQVVERCVIALDLTPAVIQEAKDTNASLIITHHPLIFRPLKSIATTHWHGALIHELIRHEIALYCIHTNLDAAYDGVSFALAEQLGLEEIRFLRPTPEAMVKLVTFVPTAHIDPVRHALKHAGAGHIGDYEGCSFVTEGTGYFTPGSATNPTIGTAGGNEEQVQESRLEVELPGWLLPQATKALIQAHPYEEVAYDVVPLQKADTRTGMGAIGKLSSAMTLHAFLKRASKVLSTPSIEFVGEPSSLLERVAVCGGSGADLMKDAMAQRADAYLTADITYHRFFDVLDTQGRPRMALINVGHYETEACTETLLAEWLSSRFDTIEFNNTAGRTSPVRYFVSQEQPSIS